MTFMHIKEVILPVQERRLLADNICLFVGRSATPHFFCSKDHRRVEQDAFPSLASTE